MKKNNYIEPLIWIQIFNINIVVVVVMWRMVSSLIVLITSICRQRVTVFSLVSKKTKPEYTKDLPWHLFCSRFRPCRHL